VKEGVYEFGSKTVLAKLERGSFKVKVAGGFISIEEFLEQYTPGEVEKLKQPDPMQKLTGTTPSKPRSGLQSRKSISIC